MMLTSIINSSLRKLKLSISSQECHITLPEEEIIQLAQLELQLMLVHIILKMILEKWKNKFGKTTAFQELLLLEAPKTGFQTTMLLTSPRTTINHGKKEDKDQLESHTSKNATLGLSI